MSVSRRTIPWLVAGVVIVVLAIVAAVVVPRLVAGDDDAVSRSAGTPQSTRPGSTPLSWQPCPDAQSDPDLAVQECAFLPVPKTWDDPASGTFLIHVRRLPAQPTAQSGTRLGSIVINQGGPGISSDAYTATALAGKMPELRARFDLVWFDPRGTGKSEPRLKPCTQALGLNQQQPEVGPYAWPQATGFRVDQQTALGRECLRLNEPEGRLIGTREVLRDIDALREALGDEQLTYLGYSYGTRIGTQYAKTFPDGVRAMVLDGTVDPSGTMLGLGRNLATGDPATVGLIRSSMAPAMQPVYDDVVRQLQITPITETSPEMGTVTTWTRWTFGQELGAIAVADSSAGLGPSAEAYICRLARQAQLPSGPCPQPDPQPTEPPRELPPDMIDWAPEASGSGGVTAAPARQLINCADLSGRPDADALAALMPPADQTDTPLTASFVLMYASMCSGLPEAWAPIG
ncbi:MAG: hypothetical protein RLZ55_187, partial [Actinomycetota bacterium]